MPIKLTSEEFIAKAILIHGSIYNYDKVVYTNSHTKVEIICSIHGSFFMAPNNHLNGQHCPLCARTSIGDKLRHTQKQFIERAKSIHGNNFDYSRVIYKDMHTPIEVIHKCGSIVHTTPANHLTSITCFKCSVENLAVQRKQASEAAKLKFYEKHKSTYRFLTEYIAARQPITVQHIVCSHIFTSTPDNLKVERCPCCADYGFNPAAPATLYYLSIDNGTYYKIGITNRSVEERFIRKDLDRIKILNTWYYPQGSIAYQKEQYILKLFSEYKAASNILASGNTEIFTTNILKLGKLNEEYFIQ